MATATFEDVAVAIGRPIADQAEQARVNYWLDAAELQIKARLGDVALLDQAALRFVETEAAAARLANPEGYQYEAIDNYRYGLPAESRQVSIRDEWWDLLTPAAAISNGPYAVPLGGADVWP